MNISEPHICIQGEQAEKIAWFASDDRGPYLLGLHNQLLRPQGTWLRYAEFERAKLETLTYHFIRVSNDGFELPPTELHLNSKELIGYDGEQYGTDSETGRLLMRAKFLKAVCKKKRIPWLPNDTCWNCGHIPDHFDPCCNINGGLKPESSESGDRGLGCSAAGASDGSRSPGEDTTDGKPVTPDTALRDIADLLVRLAAAPGVPSDVMRGAMDLQMRLRRKD